MSAAATSTRRPAPPKSRLPDHVLVPDWPRKRCLRRRRRARRTIYITARGVVYGVRLANPGIY